MLGGMTGVADKILNHVKAYFKRQWLTQNNVMPELGVLLEMDGDKPAFSLLDYMATSQSTMGRAFMEFIKHEHDTKTKVAEEFKKLIDDAGGGGDGGFGGGDEFGGDQGGDDTGGGDGFDDGMGGEPPAEEPAVGGDTPEQLPDEDGAGDQSGLEDPTQAAADEEEEEEPEL